MQHGGRDGAARFHVGAAAQGALHVAQHAARLRCIAFLDQRFDQVDVVFRVAEFRVFGFRHHLLVGPFGRADVARVEGDAAQVAQAAHHVRRDGHRVLEDFLRLQLLAHGFMVLRQQVVGGHEAGVDLHQFQQRILRFLVALLFEQGARQSQVGPGHGARGQHVGVQLFRFLPFVQGDVQLGAQAGEIGRQARVLQFGRAAAFHGFAQVALVDQLIGRQKNGAPLDGARDASAQHVDGERFQYVVGRGQLGRADHLAVDGFRGQHDEDRPQADQLVVAQVFQQLLAILAVRTAAKIVFAQDDVERFLRQQADGRAGIDGIFHLGDGRLVQHIVQVAPHAGVRVDDQDR
ncbi:hypothetical protein D3C72_1201900 [compost metagenome]